MKVKCIKNTGDYLSSVFPSISYPRTTRFQLKIDRFYTVYGILLWKGNLHYLIFDPDYYVPFPEWNPAELFDVVDTLLPMEWYFKYLRGENGETSALWGYEEMINDESHYFDLIDHKDKAMRIFLRRKSDIDET